MDKITKALNRLKPKEQEQVKKILSDIKQNNWHHYDLKKLKGNDDIYRIRKGKIRIIYRYHKDEIFILAIERRSDTTYNF